MPFVEGHDLFGQGRCPAALDRVPAAAASPAAAHGVFARLGAAPALAETDAWLVNVRASA